jgi:hypothetical protein
MRQTPIYKNTRMLMVAGLLGIAGTFTSVAAGEDKLGAQALFDEAKHLMDSGKTAEACAKFEASLELDSTFTTLTPILTEPKHDQVGQLRLHPPVRRRKRGFAGADWPLLGQPYCCDSVDSMGPADASRIEVLGITRGAARLCACFHLSAFDNGRLRFGLARILPHCDSKTASGRAVRGFISDFGSIPPRGNRENAG